MRKKRLLMVAFGLLLFWSVQAQRIGFDPNSYLYLKFAENMLYHNRDVNFLTTAGFLVKETKDSRHTSGMLESYLPIHYDISIKPLTLPYPDVKYKLYGIHMTGFDYVVKDSGLHRFYAWPRERSDFLVALDESAGSVKFISGNCIWSEVVNDFQPDTTHPSSLIPYLSCKMFDIHARDIEFVKEEDSLYFFRFYSDTYQHSLMSIIGKKSMFVIYLTTEQGNPFDFSYRNANNMTNVWELAQGIHP